MALASEVEAVLTEFEPDVVITFGEDGAYGHPDHIQIGNATALAVDHMRGASGASSPILLRSHFPARTISLAERLARWLVEMEGRFDGTSTYSRALTLFAEESTTMRFASDDVRIVWYPPDSMIVEQGEPATSLCLILSGNGRGRRRQRGGAHVHPAPRRGSVLRRARGDPRSRPLGERDRGERA